MVNYHFPLGKKKRPKVDWKCNGSNNVCRESIATVEHEEAVLFNKVEYFFIYFLFIINLIGFVDMRKVEIFILKRHTS